MLKYPSELVAFVRERYLHSTDTLEQIAAKCGINARDISKMREIEGWPSRQARIRSVPRAGEALKEAQALALSREQPTAAAVPPPDEAPRSVDPSPSLAPEGAEPPPPADDTQALIARIERLVAQELAAEETVRAALGAAPRSGRSAKRCAHTLFTLAQTLQILARLRGGVPQEGSNNDNDMPADIDEFRDELARRIRALVASDSDQEDTGGD